MCPRLRDARHVSLRTDLCQQRTPHKTALIVTAAYDVDVMARTLRKPGFHLGTRVVRERCLANRSKEDIGQVVSVALVIGRIVTCT
jgi:hypothetical protein